MKNLDNGVFELTLKEYIETKREDFLEEVLRLLAEEVCVIVPVQFSHTPKIDNERVILTPGTKASWALIQINNDYFVPAYSSYKQLLKEKKGYKDFTLLNADIELILQIMELDHSIRLLINPYDNYNFVLDYPLVSHLVKIKNGE